MKFGLIFANVGPFVEPDNAVAFARLAEECGFESLWTVEHVVVPSGYQSAYPYSPTGRMPGDEASPIPDPLVWLAYVAAATSTIRLGTGVLILPQRQPLILAKELATLDRLSSGRVELGVGVGWLEEEFAALGVPFAQRGRRTDEYVDVLRRLWTEPETSFAGEFTRFDALKSFPKPTRAGGIPIHIGGHTPAAARRAGRLGDGFMPARGDLDTLVPLLDEMRVAATAAGRDPEAVEVSTGGALDLDGVKRYADAGVHRLLLPPLSFDIEKLRARLGQFSVDVIQKAS